MNIIDVDFRYVMRPKVLFDSERVGTISTISKNNPVLQWRKRVMKVAADLNHVAKYEEEWTDWQDVRTEEE